MTTTDPDLWPVPSPEVALLFEPVLEWLDAGAPHRDIGGWTDVGFNFRYLTLPERPDYARNDCGTVCCIAGALVLFNFSRREQELCSLSDSTAIVTIGEKLGMTWHQVRSLFLGMLGDGTDLEPDWITPGMAAHAIRTFLATGRPEWIKDAAYLAREEADQ